MTLRPTLRQLHYFCSLAEKKSFRAAAEACFVSQSTLSSGIRQLEDILQAGLVDREASEFRLTRMGSEILGRAQALLRDADDLVALAQRQDKPLSGALRLGIIPSIGPFLLPRALPSLRAAYPDLKLYLREGLTRQILDDVRAGRLDAAVIALPYHVEGFGVRKLGTDRFEVALPLNHDLASLDRVAPELLENDMLILLEDGHCIRDHILSSLHRSPKLPGATAGEEIVATSLITIVQMIANGLGISLLPELALKTGLVDGLDIATVPLDAVGAERDLAIIWREHSALEPNVQLLSDHLMSFI